MEVRAAAAVPAFEEREKRHLQDLLLPGFFLVFVVEQIFQSRRSRKTSQGNKRSELGRDWVHALSPLSSTCPLCWVPIGATTISLENHYLPGKWRPSAIDPTPRFVRFHFSSHFSDTWKTTLLGFGESDTADWPWEAGKHKLSVCLVQLSCEDPKKQDFIGTFRSSLRVGGLNSLEFDDTKSKVSPKLVLPRLFLLDNLKVLTFKLPWISREICGRYDWLPSVDGRLP